jgi:hypothetical protein
MRKRRLIVAGVAAAALAVGTPVVALAMAGSGDDPGTDSRTPTTIATTPGGGPATSPPATTPAPAPGGGPATTPPATTPAPSPGGTPPIATTPLPVPPPGNGGIETSPPLTTPPPGNAEPEGPGK